MEMVLDFLQQYDVFIMIGVLFLLLILIIIQIANKIQFNRLNKKYKKLFRDSKKDTIEDMIIDYGKKVENALKYTRDVHNAFEGMDNRVKGCIQKLGVVRYRAFDDVGSDLSFSLAILDESDTGVVLTGIYGREDSTTFAKPIENGMSKYDLSEEEKDAINRAIKSFEYNNANNIKEYTIADYDTYENEENYDSEDYEEYDEEDNEEDK